MRLDDLNSGDGLLPGMFRGIPISILDASSDHGRRVLEYLFPGVDPAAYDDFGLGPSGISIEALYIGDDYKVQARLLAAAFETPGPGLLIHPWLGPISVIMEEPGQIRFSERELRVLRISARFKRAPVVALGFGFSSQLADSITGMVSAITGLVSIIASVVLSSTRISASRRSVRVVNAVAASLTTPPSARSALTSVRVALATSAPQSPLAFDAWIASASAVISTVIELSPVGSASDKKEEPSPQALMTIGLSMASGLIAQVKSAPSAIDRLLLVVAAARFVSDVAAQSPYAEFTSRNEAMTFRASMTTALSNIIDLVEDNSPDTMQAASRKVIRAGRALSAALVTDLNEVIGTLPAVQAMTTTRSVDAWAIAQHLAGDTPSRLEAVYADIVARNGPVHPANLTSGRVEFLELD
ncbi:prophage DNA circulation protein [Agrobacterium vitis]|nr:prophage DNA circulation protein [Agrobacterium vitis]